jgi:hypothetical protein
MIYGYILKFFHSLETFRWLINYAEYTKNHDLYSN